jgi:hypothetical protein
MKFAVGQSHQDVVMPAPIGQRAAIDAIRTDRAVSEPWLAIIEA